MVFLASRTQPMVNLERFQREDGAPPHVYAHRGSHDHYPENTLQAFEAAMRQGAHGIELDVQCCASGEVIVFHDADLARMAGRTDTIAQLRYSELRRIELVGGARIPLLDDVLDLLKSHELLINIELKTPTWGDKALVRELSRKLHARSLKEQSVVVCSSFSAVTVGMLLKVTSVPVTYLIGTKHAPRLRTRVAQRIPALAGIHPHFSLLDRSVVTQSHARNRLVNTWTVDQPKDIQHAASLGVDGIITNNVSLALGTLFDPTL